MDGWGKFRHSAALYGKYDGVLRSRKKIMQPGEGEWYSEKKTWLFSEIKVVNFQEKKSQIYG